MSPSLHRTSSRGKKATNTATLVPNENHQVPTKAPGGKHVCEPEDAIAESELVPAKRAKVSMTILNTNPGLRRSGRSPKPNGKTVVEKRKRRTKAKVQAAK